MLRRGSGIGASSWTDASGTVVSSAERSVRSGPSSSHAPITSRTPPPGGSNSWTSWTASPSALTTPTLGAAPPEKVTSFIAHTNLNQLNQSEPDRPYGVPALLSIAAKRTIGDGQIGHDWFSMR